MQIPFLNSSKGKIKSLQDQVSKLSEQLDEVLESDINNLQKMYESSGTDPVNTQFSIVDEVYDKASLQKLFSSQTWFYIVVNTIAKSLSSLPIKLEREKIISQNVTQPDGKETNVRRRTWIDASAEPEMDIFECPNYIQTPMEFWMLVIIDLLSTGDAYIYLHEAKVGSSNKPEDRLRRAISRVRRTNVDSMIRLNPALIEVVPVTEEDENDGIIKGYNLNADGGSYFFDYDCVVHIKLPNPSDPFTGLSPIVAVMKKVLLDQYTDEHMLRFYKQGARLGGVIETDKNLTKEQMLRLNSTFESMFTGKRNHHKTLILPNGMKYNTIEQNPGQTSLIEFLKANKEPILSAFNVPPIKIGLLDGATFSNALIQNKTFYVDTLMPLATLIGQALSMKEKLINRAKKMRVTFDFSEVEALKEDLVAKSAAAASMANGGLSIDEIREMAWGLGPKEGGDIVPLIERSKPQVPTFQLSAPRGHSKTEVINAQNDTQNITDIEPTRVTYEQRVTELVRIAMANGLDMGIAIQQACAQAIIEGFTPSTQAQVDDKSILSNVPFSKEVLASYAKVVVGDGVAEMIANREKISNEFFDRMAKFVVSKLKRKAYKHGKSFKIKAKLPGKDDMKTFIEKESDRIAESLIKATIHGYKANIPSQSIAFPNEEALSILKRISTRNVRSVVGSSLDTLKNIITSSAADQVSVGELAFRIEDVFKDISRSKAVTIARTETLTAVSVGQALKTTQFFSKFPEDAKKLKRVWLSAQDDKVRDSHSHLDGKSVRVGQKFDNGLLYPRDPAGEAGEVINCRCTFIDYLPEDQDSVLSLIGEASPLSEEV